MAGRGWGETAAFWGSQARTPLKARSPGGPLRGRLCPSGWCSQFCHLEEGQRPNDGREKGCRALQASSAPGTGGDAHRRAGLPRLDLPLAHPKPGGGHPCVRSGGTETHPRATQPRSHPDTGSASPGHRPRWQDGALNPVTVPGTQASCGCVSPAPETRSQCACTSCGWPVPQPQLWQILEKVSCFLWVQIWVTWRGGGKRGKRGNHPPV